MPSLHRSLQMKAGWKLVPMRAISPSVCKPAPNRRSQGPTESNVPVDFSFEAPGFLEGTLTGASDVRFAGSTLRINGLTGKIGASKLNGWASFDFSSKLLVKGDLDVQRLDIMAARPAAGGGAASAPGGGRAQSQAGQPWSSQSLRLAGLNYVDADVQLSAAELNVGTFRFAPIAVHTTLTDGHLDAALSRTGMYGGQVEGTATVDVSGGAPVHAFRIDLRGARALQLLSDVAGFEALDGRLQAKFDVRASGESERAVMSSLSGTVDTRIQDGQILGINVPKMIRTLTAKTLTGWQESRTESTDLSDLSASFRIENGRATTSNLRLLGPLVRVNGSGSIDLAAKTLQFKLDPKLVASLQGQGGAPDPLGFGVPVNVEGSWSDPRIYPDVAGILSDPDDAYAKLNALGQGLFGKGQGGLDALMQGLGTLLGPRNEGKDDRRPPAGAKPSDRPDANGAVGDFLRDLFSPVTLHEGPMEDTRRNWLRPSGLFGKYVVAFVGLVVFVLAVNVALETWSMYRETTVTVASAESEKAEATAHRIDQFLSEIERQISWVTRASVVTLEQRRADYAQLLQQVSAIDELTQLDGDGREQLRVSRFDVALRRGAEYSRDPRFAEAVARGSWWSPVSFRGDVPHVMFAMAHPGRNAGVTVAELNLKFLSDFVTARDAGKLGYAYIVGPQGRLLASSDPNWRVGTDLSGLPQVAAMTSGAKPAAIGADPGQHQVLVGAAAIPSINLFVFFEQPLNQAISPIYGFLIRIGWLLGLKSLRSPSSPACSWRGTWWCRSTSCSPARAGSPRASSTTASRSTPRTSSRTSPISSTGWPASSMNPIRAWSTRWRNAPAISPSPSASSRGSRRSGAPSRPRSTSMRCWRRS